MVAPSAAVAFCAMAPHSSETTIRFTIIIVRIQTMMAAETIAKAPHDFRRTALRNLERAGVSRSAAMKLVGHKTESVYRRYAIVAKQDLIDGLKRLAEHRTIVKAESKIQEDVGGSVLKKRLTVNLP
jgi:hypothetical protein